MRAVPELVWLSPTVRSARHKALPPESECFGPTSEAEGASHSPWRARRERPAILFRNERAGLFHANFFVGACLAGVGGRNPGGDDQRLRVIRPMSSPTPDRIIKYRAYNGCGNDGG